VQSLVQTRHLRESRPAPIKNGERARGVTNLLLGTATFGILSAGPSLLLTLASLFSNSPPRPNPWDDFLLMAYLAGMTKGLATLGFLISTAFSQSWRRLGTWRALVIAGALGLAEPIASLAVLAAGSSVLLPLFRSALWGHLPSHTVSRVCCSACRLTCWPGGSSAVSRRREHPARALGGTPATHIDHRVDDSPLNFLLIVQADLDSILHCYQQRLSRLPRGQAGV
jgi:hypothetical protein